jgi:endogenous inhibitor of DNA gyrase (YacG/DUF329 family)
VAREITCPRCGTRREWSGNPWRPFCSERCKLIDLGRWLSGHHRVAAEPHAEPGDGAERAADDAASPKKST